MKISPPQKAILIIFLLTLIYYLPGVLSPRDFWVEDEARYGEVLREMVHEGRWMVPHLNGSFYPDKPPLYFWSCAALALVFGQINPWICMIITWITTFGTVVTAYLLGRRLFNERSAMIGVVVLLSTLLFLGCAQIVRMDMMMTWFVMLALTFFYRGYNEKRPVLYLWFYLFTALAIMSKGPFGLTFSLFPAMVYLILKKEWRNLRRFIINPGWLIIFLIVGVWLGLAWLGGHHDYVHNLFFKQMAGRAVKAFSHAEPFYYYLLFLPFVFLPWTPFLIRALRFGIQQQRPQASFLLSWFLTGFIVISAVSGKLVIYLLPLLPPLTILLGAFFDHFLKSNASVSSMRTESILSLILSFGSAALVPFIIHMAPGVQTVDFRPLAWIFIPLLILGLVLVMLKYNRFLFVLITAGIWLFSFIFFQRFVPQANELYSARSIGIDIKTLSAQGKIVSSVYVRRGIFNFYADQLIPRIAVSDIPGYFSVPDRALVIKKNDFKKHKAGIGKSVTIYSEYEIAIEQYIIVVQEGE